MKPTPADVLEILRDARKRHLATPPNQRVSIDQPHNAQSLFRGREIIALGLAGYWPLNKRTREWLSGAGKDPVGHIDNADRLTKVEQLQREDREDIIELCKQIAELRRMVARPRRANCV